MKHTPGQSVNAAILGPEPVQSPTPAEESERMVAARGQDVLAGLPRYSRCEYCGEIYPRHTTSCKYDQERMMDDKQPGPIEEEPIVITKEMLKRYCDQARAYGWEAGLRYAAGEGALRPIYESSPQNPFVHPDWDKNLRLPQGWQLTFKENPL